MKNQTKEQKEKKTVALNQFTVTTLITTYEAEIAAAVLTLENLLRPSLKGMPSLHFPKSL